MDDYIDRKVAKINKQLGVNDIEQGMKKLNEIEAKMKG